MSKEGKKAQAKTPQKNPKKASPKKSGTNKSKELEVKQINQQAKQDRSLLYFILACISLSLLLLGVISGNEAIIQAVSFLFGKSHFISLVLITFVILDVLWGKAQKVKANSELDILFILAILCVSGFQYGLDKPAIDPEGFKIFSAAFELEKLTDIYKYFVDRGVVNVLCYGSLSAIVGHMFTQTIFLVGIVAIIVWMIGLKRVYWVIVRILDILSNTAEKSVKKVQQKTQETIKDNDFKGYFKKEENKPKKSSIFINADAKKTTSAKHLQPQQLQKEPDDTVDFTSSPERVEHIDEPKEVHNNTRTLQPQKVAQPVPANNENKKYKLPDIKLLDRAVSGDNETINYDYAEEKGEELIKVLNDFNIEAELICFHVGPAVTKFEIRPTAKIKVSKILELQDNIKMELAVKDVRIEAPIPGKNTIGVEIPNKNISVVKLKELLTKERMKNNGQPKLSVILGKNLLGETVYCDLTKMPHLLVAGATGSGKSVCMNSIIMSILYRATPDEVKLVLIDPKKVEFSNYANLPHLISPVITDSAEAARALKIVVKIMDDRYNQFAEAGAKNIKTYNDKVEKGLLPNAKKMPFIVVIIDELADLMLVAGKDVEGSIQRITQLARAAGIHLIVATQRPSTDVITGIIKANIPSRIAFAVSNGVDSKVILDRPGAEKLLGFGDMLYSPIGVNVMCRAQGVYVADEEIERVIEFVTSQRKPQFDDTFINAKFDEEEENGTYNGKTSKDPMYDEVKAYVIETKKASTSLLQRRFGLGYNRAARLIDMLEANGIVGPANGSKPRDVYV